MPGGTSRPASPAKRGSDMRRSNRASRALFLGAAFLLALFAPGFAVAADIGEKLSALMAEHDAVGLAVVVVRDNEVVYRNSLGWKDRQARIPLEEDDVFRIASISKSFAAASILQLVEQGRLSLDDDVGELLGFPVRNPGFPDHAITLRMLLNHTSSITDSQRYGSLDIINPDASDSWSESYYEHVPGEQYEYSYLGYNMVGAIIVHDPAQRFVRFEK